MEDLLVTILASSVVGSVVGILLSATLEHQRSKVMSKADALTIAVELEGYAIDCADKLVKHDDAERYQGDVGKYLGGVPKFHGISIGAAFFRWRKVSIANRIAVFPHEIQQSNQRVEFCWDMLGDIEATRAEAVEQVSKMGHKSVNLARDIRARFGLPDRKLVFGPFNVEDVLTERMSRVPAD